MIRRIRTRGVIGFLRCIIVLLVCHLPAGQAQAGSFFLTGHDPDYHAVLGGNTTGARHITVAAIAFIMDPAFNPFVASGVDKFLFVEAKIAPPGGHINGVNGVIVSGFTSGVDFEHHDASTLNAELDKLGTKYSAIVVASDFGGVLTQAELDILNARSQDIINFLNAGGGIYAMAQGNGGAGLTPGGGHFGFLPFVVSSTAFDQSETGITLTAFGASLGLTTSDVNGNFSHNIFLGAFGLQPVDIDSSNNILTLAGRRQVGIALTPLTATNQVGASHTVTAKLVDDNNNPVPGLEITFEVISGPNQGATGTDTSDANGEATFTYTGDGGLGTDTLQARFVNASGDEVSSNTAEKIWEEGPVPLCFGRPATIFVRDGVIVGGPDDGKRFRGVLHGTAGDDVIVGTEGNDLIKAFGGNDVICGLGGNDVIEGGPGDDWIDGGAGNDLIKGQEGNDTIYGGEGHDIIEGGPGDDWIDGGPGNDRIKGQEGNDILYGGEGNDILDGGPGDDYLDGGPGTDTLKGGAGTDTCINGEANSACEL